jgi:hypothetical protein
MTSELHVVPAATWPEYIANLVGSYHVADRYVADDLSSALSVAQLRELQDFATRTPVSGKAIAVVHGADMLRRDAANTLLKLLEEPPAFLRVVLVAATSKLMPTLRSRVVMPAQAAAASTEQWFDEQLRTCDLTQATDRLIATRALRRAILLHPQVSRDIVLPGITAPHLP